MPLFSSQAVSPNIVNISYNNTEKVVQDSSKKVARFFAKKYGNILIMKKNSYSKTCNSEPLSQYKKMNFSISQSKHLVYTCAIQPNLYFL